MPGAPTYTARLTAAAGLVVSPRCGGCGDALRRESVPLAWCTHCRVRWGPPPGPWPLHGGGCPGWAAAVYRGRVRRAVLMAKRGAPAAAEELLLARWPAGKLPPGTVVTWVPAHPRRVLRGPDAGRGLAMALARREGLGVRPMLRRSPLARRQAGRPDVDRRAAPERLGLRVQGAVPASVALVDDVRTTGATLDHAAELLRANGATTVFGVVVAAAPRGAWP